MLAVVVLAAGAGSRMGGVAKCLITVNGTTLLQRLLRAVHTLGPAQTVLVLGHHADTIRKALREMPALQPLVEAHNPDPGDSPASSLRVGLQALTPEVNTIVVLLADQPLLGAKDLQSALRAFEDRSPAQRILWPLHDGAPGHPVLMQADLASEWLAQHDAGLRPWAMRLPQQVGSWEPGNPHHTRDLDTPEDLRRLTQDTGASWELPPVDASFRQT